MVAMHYEGNMNTEKDQLAAITDNVGTSLDSINTTVSGMSAYWKDEKSEQFISDTTELIKEAKSLLDAAKADGDTIFSQVEAALSIYES